MLGKILGDFKQERIRTGLVVLAMALGIAGFCAVLSAYGILTRELNQGYLATNPASATLTTDKIDDALLAAIASNRGLSDVEARRVVSGRIKAGPAQWRNLTLFVVKDFGKIRVSTLQPEHGAWPPATGEILIERDALQVARARIGDMVTVKTAASQEQALRLSGSVHDVGQAQARMENGVYGYITVATLAQLGEQPFLDQLNILVAQDRFNVDHIRNVVAEVRKSVESLQHPVRRVSIPQPGKHPHAEIMGLLLLAMSGFGFVVLALSGILVVNLLSALMASQVGQIGVMKAIGGTRWRIARIYFAQALLMGAAAILIGVPIGVWGSRELCRYLAVFLNFDIGSFAAPAWVYLLVAVIGLLVPLFAAGYPVWKGTGISVREALADSGVSSNVFGASAFDRALAGMSGPFRPLLLAIRNSFRQRTRLVLTLITLSASGLFFMSALNIRASMINTLDRLFSAKKFDLSVSLASMYPFEKVERALRNTPGIVRAEGWITTRASFAKGGGGGAAKHGHGGGAPTNDGFVVIALPTNTKLLTPEISEGRGLLAGDTDAIVLNSALASSEPGTQAGSTVTLIMGPGQMSWRVVGIAREPFSPATAYISKEYLEQVGGHDGMANSVRLKLEKTDAASIDSVKASLDRSLEREGLRALASASKLESRFSFDQHMLMIYVFLIVMAGIIGGVGGLGLMTTMSLNVLERRREMGVLRAIGASPRIVWLIVVAESLIIGVLSWLLAALVAWPFSRALGSVLTVLMFRTPLDFSMELIGLVIWFVVSVSLGILAGFLPAWRASKLTVREALANS